MKQNWGTENKCVEKKIAGAFFFGKKIGIDGSKGFLVTIFHVVSFSMRYETNHTEGDHVVSVAMNGRMLRSSAKKTFLG